MPTVQANALGAGPVALSGAIAKLRPVGSGGFRFHGGFWGTRQQLVREVTLPHAQRRLFDAGNVDNLRRLALGDTGPYRGRIYADSDVYKVAEAMCWDLGTEPSPSSDRLLASVARQLSSVQDDSGYLNSWYRRTRLRFASPTCKWATRCTAPAI